MAAKTETQDKIKEITDRLEEGIQNLFTSDKYMEYLRTMSKFYRYSTRNTLLIHQQMPTASRVASFNAWKKDFERYVKKGEHGIWILAPVGTTMKKEMDKLDPDTQKPLLDRDGNIITEEIEVKIPRFKAVPVFDVSQTDGKPLPSLAEDLTGDVRQYEAFLDALKQISPLPIMFEPIDDKDGYCRYGEKIGIREGMSEIQTVCAVIHEITHAKLHDIEALREQDANAKAKDKMTKEVESESVAYAVSQYYGIETGANSFGYVLNWSSNRELPELKASLDTIRKTTAALIESIDGKFKEIVKERGIDLTAEASERETAAPVEPEKTPDMPLSSQEQQPQELEYEPDEVFRTLCSFVVSRSLYDEAYLNARKDFKDEPNARIECGKAISRIIEKLTEQQQHLDLCHCYFNVPGFKERLENYVFQKTYTDIEKQLEKISRIGQPKEQRENTIPHRNYRALMKLAPEVIEGTYSYMRFQAGESFMPLTFEHLSDNRYSLMHYFMQSGDMMRDPDMELIIDSEQHTINAVTYTQHPFFHQEVRQGGARLQRELNSFLSQWLKNIEQQRYKPEIAKFYNQFHEITETVHFNADRKPFTVHMGHMGNGLTVWNTLEEVHGDYKTIAHIGADRTVKFYEDNLPSAVIKLIEEEAQTSQMTVSTTQDTPVFNTPPQSGEQERNDVVGTIEEIEREYPPYAGILPDAAIGLADRNEYGYTYDGLLPLRQERALELFDNGSAVFLLYPDNTEGMAESRDDILDFDGILGIEVEDWERSSLYAEMMKDNPTAEADKFLESIGGIGNLFGKPTPPPKVVEKAMGNMLYEKLAEMFPKFMSGEYSTLLLESGAGTEPLSLKWLNSFQITVMHTYTQNGELCYNPKIVFELGYGENDSRTLNAVEFEKSEPYVYQIKEGGGHWRSVDENDNEKVIFGLQKTINDFSAQWFDNIAQQGYVPVNADMEIDGEKMQITFDADGQPVMPEQSESYEITVFTYEDGGYNTVAGSFDNRQDAEAFACLLDNDGFYSVELKAIADGEEYPITVSMLFDEAQKNERAVEQFNKYKAELEPSEKSNKTELAAEEAVLFKMDEVLPDTAIGLSEMNLYGYSGADILPLLKDRALELFDADHTVYMLYPDGTDAMAIEREDITAHNGIFGIETAEWIAAVEFTDMVKATENSEASREALLIYGKESVYGIYQLKRGDETRDYRFEPFDRLQDRGLEVDRRNYELVYSAPLTIRDTLTNLNMIYDTLNNDRPADFIGHSLSVSDVIVLQWRGQVSSHYVDDIGFKELPVFTGNETDRSNALNSNYVDTLREHIQNQADTGYLMADDVKILQDNIDVLNTQMLKVSALYDNGMPLDVETDTIDRLFQEMLQQTKNRQEKQLAAPVIPQKPVEAIGVHKNSSVKADGKEKPSILSQVEKYKTIVSQGNESQKNAPKRDTNKEV